MAKAKSATSRRINIEELKQSLLQDEEFLAAIAATLPAPAQFPGFAGAKQQDYSGIEARSNPGPKPASTSSREPFSSDSGLPSRREAAVDPAASPARSVRPPAIHVVRP